MTPPVACAVQTRERQHCTPPAPRLWQRRPPNVLLVMVLLLLLLGSPRVRRDVESVAVEPRLKGVGPSRAKTAVEPRLQGVGPSRAKTIIYVSVAVYPRLKGVGRSRGKTIISIFPGGLPLLLKKSPSSRGWPKLYSLQRRRKRSCQSSSSKPRAHIQTRPPVVLTSPPLLEN